MKSLICILLMGSLALVTCKKDKGPEIYNIEQHIKDWMFFDTGTYWVYKELNSGAIDSHYVIKSEIVINETSGKRKNEPYIKAQSGFVHINRGYFFLLASPFGSSVIEKIKETGTEWGSTYLKFKPLEVGQRKGASGLDYTEIRQIDPHFTLDNIRYDTLITLLENYDLTEHNDSVEYKVLKGVGIINKKNITMNQEWKLIKYHINLNKQ